MASDAVANAASPIRSAPRRTPVSSRAARAPCQAPTTSRMISAMSSPDRVRPAVIPLSSETGPMSPVPAMVSTP
ncbi:MAG: hypothetical protein HOV76_01935 [Hamadaea sp.]|nr:hypothetical protein [Hamadaea sp.]